MNGYFFDMDGTLYNNKFHEVSEKTFKMLNELQRQGHFVALCTSRCQTELKNLPSCMRNFQFNCMISDGGALILDRHKEVLEMNCISKATMKTIDSFCKEHGLVYRYSTRNGNYFGTPYSKYAHDIYFHLYLNSPIFKPYENDDVLNLLVFCEGKDKEKFRPLIKDLGIVEFFDCFEIRANQIDKATAVKKIMDFHKFDTTYCFGDGTNDVDMLKTADVGVAMGNACDALKEVSDVVIGRVDEDGIYNYLMENKS